VQILTGKISSYVLMHAGVGLFKYWSSAN